MPGQTTVGYQSFDAAVTSGGDANHGAYLEALEKSTEAAIEKIQNQIEGLKESLAAKRAELKSVKAARKTEG
jgi:hypothetical protein